MEAPTLLEYVVLVDYGSEGWRIASTHPTAEEAIEWLFGSSLYGPSMVVKRVLFMEKR
jgi:hypothetical protein